MTSAIVGAAWTRQAACRGCWGVDFFPESGGTGHEAKSICRRCEVRASCLDHALDHHEAGIWGGTTEPERAQMRRADAVRRRAAQPGLADVPALDALTAPG